MKRTSAGLVIIQNNKILLCHPTHSEWKNTFSIPKGHIEANETILQTAIRETKEEVGIIIHPDDIDSTQYVMKYLNSHGKTSKIIWWCKIIVIHLQYV